MRSNLDFFAEGLDRVRDWTGSMANLKKCDVEQILPYFYI